MKLYYHKSDGGAEYLCTKRVPKTAAEGDLNHVVIRLDGKPEAFGIFAAAPELLEALKSIAGWSKCQCRTKHGDNINCCVLVAEQAIQQAEGDVAGARQNE